jgi:hypothetical protein
MVNVRVPSDVSTEALIAKVEWKEVLTSSRSKVAGSPDVVVQVIVNWPPDVRV